MARILLAWELGSGQGHVRTLARLAEPLAAAGHELVFAVKNLSTAATVMPSQSWPVLQAPYYHPTAAPKDFLAASYADILAIRGFARVSDLMPMVDAWQHLINLVGAEWIIASHAPTLALATFGDLKGVRIGTGFTVPPSDGSTFPPLVPDREPLVPSDQLFEVVQEVQRRRGRPAPPRLPALFEHLDPIVVAVPELDPYRHSRHDGYVVPILHRIERTPLPTEPKFFAYLNGADPRLEAIALGLVESGCPGFVYVQAATTAQRHRLRQLGLSVVDEPVPVRETLPTVTLLVHHGGMGLTSDALAGGRPQLLFPTQLEQYLTARQLQKLGVGEFITGPVDSAHVAQTVQHMLRERRYGTRALAFAQTLAQHIPANPAATVADHCLKLLQ